MKPLLLFTLHLLLFGLLQVFGLMVSSSYAAATSYASICGLSMRPRSPWRAFFDRNAESDNYIVGGIDSSNSEFPWIVSFRRHLGGNRVSSHFCAGSIVSDRAIVTAAHCVEDFSSSSPIVVVVYDSYGQLSMRLIEEVTIHPAYDPRNNDYDLAIVRLQTPFDFASADSHLRPICLPEPGDEVETWPSCIVAGWGVLSFGQKRGPRTLMKTDVQIIEKSVCRRNYMLMTTITSRMFCAGDPEHGNRGTCQGDSGGPLMCLRRDRRYQLSGVTSWGANCGLAKYPAVFTDVQKLLRFIEAYATAE